MLRQKLCTVFCLCNTENILVKLEALSGSLTALSMTLSLQSEESYFVLKLNSDSCRKWDVKWDGPVSTLLRPTVSREMITSHHAYTPTVTKMEAHMSSSYLFVLKYRIGCRDEMSYRLSTYSKYSKLSRTFKESADSSHATTAYSSKYDRHPNWSLIDLGVSAVLSDFFFLSDVLLYLVLYFSTCPDQFGCLKSHCNWTTYSWFNWIPLWIYYKCYHLTLLLSNF